MIPTDPMTQDDEPTPQVRPSETAVESDDPAVYLPQSPTPEEYVLAEQIDLRNGPSIAAAKVALRQRRQAMWVSRMDGLFRSARRNARAAFATIAINAAGIAGCALHRAAQDGAAEERAAAGERAFLEYRSTVAGQLKDLREDVRELRLALRRISGAPVPQSDDADRLLPPPDKVGMLFKPHADEEPLLCTGWPL